MKVKTKLKDLLLFILLVISAFCFMGCEGGGASNPEPSPAPSPTPDPPPVVGAWMKYEETGRGGTYFGIRIESQNNVQFAFYQDDITLFEGTFDFSTGNPIKITRMRGFSGQPMLVGYPDTAEMYNFDIDHRNDPNYQRTSYILYNGIKYSFAGAFAH